jgi:hypothetical protein
MASTSYFPLEGVALKSRCAAVVLRFSFVRDGVCRGSAAEWFLDVKAAASEIDVASTKWGGVVAGMDLGWPYGG